MDKVISNKKDIITKLNNYDRKILTKYAYSYSNIPEVNSASALQLGSKILNEKWLSYITI